MKLLLINSASSDPFCAFYTGDNLTVSFSSDFLTDTSARKNLRQQDKLINCLHKISQQHRPDFQNIDAISVITGPGSFTGIRVGISIAKGLSLALNKKIIPITNFELTLNRLPKIESGIQYCVLIPAKLPEYYYAFIQDGKELSKGYIDINVILTPSTRGKNPFDKSQLVGDFDDETKQKLDYFDLINVRDKKPETDSMLELSVKYYNEGKLLLPENIEPLYIKDFIIRPRNS